MKHKKIVCGITSLALVSAIAPYYPIVANADTTMAEKVATVVEDNYNSWNELLNWEDDEHTLKGVTFLDIDLDGELELVVCNQQGTIRDTYMYAYKIDVANNTITKLEEYTDNDIPTCNIDLMSYDLELFTAIESGGETYSQGDTFYIGTDLIYGDRQNMDTVQVKVSPYRDTYYQRPLFKTSIVNGISTEYEYYTFHSSGEDWQEYDGDTSSYYQRLKNLNLTYKIVNGKGNISKDELIDSYNAFSYDGFEGNDSLYYKCGDNAKWSFDDSTGTLTISGTGELYQYYNFNIPWGRYDIKSVTIEEGITNVCDYAFYNKKHLTEVNLPSSITTIGHDAFANCTSLTKIKLPANVTTIGDSAFYGCNSLYDINLPIQTTSIGKNAFNRCYALTSIFLPESLTAIQENTFANCTALTDITICNSVVLIDDNAFENCASLQSIVIPERVATVSTLAFNSCTKLNSITVSPNNKSLCSVDGVLFNYDKTALIRYPIGRTESTYTIPDTVVSIEEYAFSMCSSLTDIRIPDSVKCVHYGAFNRTPYLDTIVSNSTDYVILGNGILYSYIGEDTNLVVPDGVVSICDKAFDNGVVSITLPNSLEYIIDGAFPQYGLKDIYYNGTTTEWNAIKKNNSLIPDSITIHCSDGIATKVNGDVNGDGKVSVKDLVALKKYLLGASEVGGDVNGDGKITVLDLMVLKKILLQS